MFNEPHYRKIKEFDLSNKIIETTNGDATVVYDVSTRQYKLLSKENYYRTKVLEVLVLKRNDINLGLIHHLKKVNADINRLSRISKHYMNQKILKNFNANKENITADYLKRIKINRGYGL